MYACTRCAPNLRQINMGKQNKAVKTEVVVAVAETTVQKYTFGKVPRSGLNQGTKHGQGGTAGTYQAVATALKAGPLTLTELKAITAANGDAGFARYAVRMQWVVPVTAE